MVRVPPGYTGAPGSRVVSSARHIASPDASRHATPASHRGIATPSSAAAASVPFHPWPSTRAKGRRSNRTQVPRSVRADRATLAHHTPPLQTNVQRPLDPVEHLVDRFGTQIDSRRGRSHSHNVPC